MKAAKSNNFGWDRLLEQIKRKNVIPVIGQGLYRVEIESEGKNNCLLYDYLAKQVAKACKATLHPEETHQFAKACFEFLNKNNNDYLALSGFLKETLKKIRLIPANPLWKLTRIKSFDMFITTVYDNFLADTIKTIRSIHTHIRYYTVHEKNLNLLTNDLFASFKDSRSTLVYQIFGNMDNCMEPAYTERDILENIVQFQIEMANNTQNSLFMKLRSSSLLFLGCEFDDWLFRFFIRTVANKPYELPFKKQKLNFVVDDFVRNKKDPFQELPGFLKNYTVELFHSSQVSDFVDMLLKRVEKNQPEEIIHFSDFPGDVFISFEGTDRPAARRLTENLRSDGFDVWLDEREFKGGDAVDETIIKAINKCKIFIPLVSKNSQKIQTEDGKLKYHQQEWHQVYTNKTSSKKGIKIIPLKIDDTKWIHDKFRNIFHLNIPGGGREGDYEKLISQMKDILKKQDKK